MCLNQSTTDTGCNLTCTTKTVVVRHRLARACFTTIRLPVPPSNRGSCHSAHASHVGMPRTVTRVRRCHVMASRLAFASVGLAGLSCVSRLLAAAGVTATSPRTYVFVEAAGGTAAFGAVNGATAAFMTVALVALVVIACVCIARRKCFNVDNGHVVEPKSVSASRRADILERWMVLHPPSLTPPDVEWSAPPTVSLQAVELHDMSPVSTSFVKHVHKAGWQVSFCCS